MVNQKRILVVGAGITGLVAASALKKNYHVTLLDKGFGIGGRMASRPLKNGDEVLGWFDYGMQYFTAVNPDFRAWVDNLVQQNIVTRWGEGFPGTSNGEPSTSSDYFRGVKSNRAIADYLASDLQVINQTRVNHVSWAGEVWDVRTTDERVYQADAILMTSPIPQTLEIFDQSRLKLPEEMRSQLSQVSYAPCLSLMAVFDQASRIPEPGGLRLKDSCLYWIASNDLKGISEGYAVTLLGTSEYSEQNWDGEADTIIAEMLEAAREWVSPKSAIATRLHRWKYSVPTQVFGARSVTVKGYGPLVLAGDAFSESTAMISQNLENAYLSGIDAANTLFDST